MFYIKYSVSACVLFFWMRGRYIPASYAVAESELASEALLEITSKRCPYCGQMKPGGWKYKKNKVYDILGSCTLSTYWLVRSLTRSMMHSLTLSFLLAYAHSSSYLGTAMRRVIHAIPSSWVHSLTHQFYSSLR